MAEVQFVTCALLRRPEPGGHCNLEVCASFCNPSRVAGSRRLRYSCNIAARASAAVHQDEPPCGKDLQHFPPPSAYNARGLKPRLGVC